MEVADLAIRGRMAYIKLRNFLSKSFWKCRRVTVSTSRQLKEAYDHKRERRLQNRRMTRQLQQLPEGRERFVKFPSSNKIELEADRQKILTRWPQINPESLAEPAKKKGFSFKLGSKSNSNRHLQYPGEKSHTNNNGISGREVQSRTKGWSLNFVGDTKEDSDFSRIQSKPVVQLLRQRAADSKRDNARANARKNQVAPSSSFRSSFRDPLIPSRRCKKGAQFQKEQPTRSRSSRSSFVQEDLATRFKCSRSFLVQEDLATWSKSSRLYSDQENPATRSKSSSLHSDRENLPTRSTSSRSYSVQENRATRSMSSRSYFQKAIHTTKRLEKSGPSGKLSRRMENIGHHKSIRQLSPTEVVYKQRYRYKTFGKSWTSWLRNWRCKYYRRESPLGNLVSSLVSLSRKWSH